MRKKLLLPLCCLCVAAGCAKPPPKQPYAQIPALPAKTATSSSSIRLQAVQDAALTVGTQGGLAWRAHQINQMLLQEQTYLDHIFNFNALLLNNNVLPPVLAEGDQTLNVASPTALRLADHVYRIIQPPQFVTAAPIWRDYLWMNYPAPDTPNNTLLPQNEEERDLWNKCVKTGWEYGIKQANDIFSANLGRLKRDYDGMILYRKLLAQNMVTAPYVAKVNLGVTGNGTAMRINDQVLRITATSELNTNAQTWKPIVRPGTAGGENTDVDEAAP